MTADEQPNLSTEALAPSRAQELPAVETFVGKAGAVQRRVALGVLVLPALSFVAAVALSARIGFGMLEAGLLAGMYFAAMFGITGGFHRHFAHRAFRTSRPMRIALAILGSIAAQGPLLFWVTAHRRHHAYSDGPGDPHSPNLSGTGVRGRIKGFLHAHMGWMLNEDVSNWARFARDILQDRYLVRMHQLYPLWLLLGLLVPAAIGALVRGGWIGALDGLLWGGLARIFLVNQASWCVGSICHMFGKRPFPTPDRSGNVKWVAWLTFGEGLQNNHHTFPSSAMHALRWWEPDISGWTIRLLQRLGLVWDVKFPSQAVQKAALKRDYAGLDPKMQGIL